MPIYIPAPPTYSITLSTLPNGGGAATLDVPYPAGIKAGDRLVFGRCGSTLASPGADTSFTPQFDETVVADGTESGSVTFQAYYGYYYLAAFIVRFDGFTDAYRNYAGYVWTTGYGSRSGTSLFSNYYVAGDPTLPVRTMTLTMGYAGYSTDAIIPDAVLTTSDETTLFSAGRDDIPHSMNSGFTDQVLQFSYGDWANWAAVPDLGVTLTATAGLFTFLRATRYAFTNAVIPAAALESGSPSPLVLPARRFPELQLPHQLSTKMGSDA